MVVCYPILYYQDVFVIAAYIFKVRVGEPLYVIWIPNNDWALHLLRQGDTESNFFFTLFVIQRQIYHLYRSLNRIDGEKSS